jgi:predicted transcriptional regulator
MAKITREEIVRNNGYHDGHETVRDNVASDSLKSLVTVPYRSIQDTERLILQVCNKANRGLSRAEICKRIKRAKAPGIVRLIEHLVEVGYLVRHHHDRPNGVIMFTYTISPRIDAYGNKFPDWLE